MPEGSVSISRGISLLMVLGILMIVPVGLVLLLLLVIALWWGIHGAIGRRRW